MKRSLLIICALIGLNAALPVATGIVAALNSKLYGGAALILTVTVAWYAAVLLILRIRRENGGAQT